MRSKRFCCKWFNFGIWRKQTLRYWPIWGSYLAFWLLSMPQLLTSVPSYEPEMQTYRFGLALMQSLNGAAGGIALYAVLIAVALYSYLYSSRSVNLFHALPLRRDTLFCTNFVTGLSFLVVPHLVMTGAFALMQVACNATGDVVPLLTWLAVTTMLSVFFFGLASLCAMVTASKWMLPVLYGVMNFLVVCIESILRWLAELFLWGVSSSGSTLQKWSPLAYIYSNGLENNRAECLEYGTGSALVKGFVRFEDWGYAALLMLAGLAFAALGMWLYRRWKSESAGDLMAFAFLRPVFTYAWAAGCSLVLGSMLFAMLGEGSLVGALFGYDGINVGRSNQGGALLFVLCMLLGGTVGYFSANMLQRKSFRVFKRRDWLGYGAFLLALLAVLLGVKFDVLGIEGWTPDVAEVEAVWIGGERVTTSVKDGGITVQQVIGVHRAILDQRELLQAQQGKDVDYVNEYFRTLLIQYELKDGRRVARRYNLLMSKEIIQDPTTPLGILHAMLDSEAQRLERSKLDRLGTVVTAKLQTWCSPKDPAVWEEISFYVNEEVPELLGGLKEALLADMREGSIGVSDFFAEVYHGGKYQEGWANLSITDEKQMWLEFYLPPDCPNTMAWVKAAVQAYQAKHSSTSQNDIIAGVQ